MEQALTTLEQTALRAPVAGTVSSVNGTVGQSSSGSTSSSSSGDDSTSSSTGFVTLTGTGRSR